MLFAIVLCFRNWMQIYRTGYLGKMFNFFYTDLDYLSKNLVIKIKVKKYTY